MNVQPYLFFDGCCEEALEFYKKTLGAEVTALMRFKDGPPPSEPGACPPFAPNTGDKVMHANLQIGNAQIMASDGLCAGRPKFEGFALSLTVDGDAEAERLFAALGEGGKVIMPMTTTFFSSRFGMVADRFGVAWQVIAMPKS